MATITRREALSSIGAATVAAYASPAIGQSLENVSAGRLSLISDSAFFIAEKKGFFRDAGVNVTWTTFPSSQQVVAPLAAGQIDVAGAACGAGIWNAIGRKIPIKIVGDRGIDTPRYGTSVLVVRSDLAKSGRFKKLADLKGLRVAEPGKGSTNLAILAKILRRARVSYDDIQHLYLPFADQVAALRNGSMDAGILVEPYATVAIREGSAHRVLSDDTVYPNHQISVLLYGTQFIARRPDAARKFMIGYVRGLRYYHDALRNGRLSGPTANDVIDILQSELKLPDPSVFRALTPSSVNPDGYVNVQSLLDDYTIFKDYGLIVDETSVPQAVDMRYVEQAYKVLGRYRPA